MQIICWNVLLYLLLVLPKPFAYPAIGSNLKFDVHNTRLILSNCLCLMTIFFFYLTTLKQYIFVRDDNYLVSFHPFLPRVCTHDFFRVFYFSFFLILHKCITLFSFLCTCKNKSYIKYVFGFLYTRLNNERLKLETVCK